MRQQSSALLLLSSILLCSRLTLRDLPPLPWATAISFRSVRRQLLSATLSDSSAEGDALSTACFVLGLEKGMELAVSAGVEAIFIDENYELHFTPGFSTPYTLPE